MAKSQGAVGAATVDAAGRQLPPEVRLVFGDLRFRIDEPLLALFCGPDGTAWSIEEPGVLRHWTLPDGRQLAHVPLGEGGVIWAFSHDGALLAGGSSDLTIWDRDRGEPLVTVAAEAWLTALAFHPDRRFLATGDEGGRVRLWQTVDGSLRGELVGHSQPISALAFSPNGKILASAAEDRIICLWDVDSGALRGKLEGHNGHIHALTWHPNSQFLVSAGWDTMARVWDTTTCQPVILLNGHAEVVSAVQFSPDGKLLAAADSDHIIWLWDPLPGKVVHQLRGHASEIACLAFSPDGNLLLSGGQDRRILCWQVSTGQNLSGVADPMAQTGRVAVSPDGQRLAYVNGSPLVRIWRTSDGSIEQTYSHRTGVSAVAFARPSGWLATGDSEGTIHLWPPKSQAPTKTLKAHKTAITALAFSPTGDRLASAGATDGYVYIWSLDADEPILLIPEATALGTVETLAFLPDGRRLVAGGVDWLGTNSTAARIIIWDVVDQCKVASLPGATSALALRPDGKWLAATSLADSVCLYDVDTTTLQHELIGHDGAVTALAWSPDGSMLVTGGEDGTIRVYQEPDWRLKRTIDLGTPVQDLAFAPTGSRLYTANANSTCYALDL